MLAEKRQHCQANDKNRDRYSSSRSRDGPDIPQGPGRAAVAVMTAASRYGPWAIVAGASDGTGVAFAVELARRGINLVLVARRQPLLEELAAGLDVQTRVVPLDLSLPGAVDELVRATGDLEIGLLVYNAGA